MWFTLLCERFFSKDSTCVLRRGRGVTCRGAVLIIGFCFFSSVTLCLVKFVYCNVSMYIFDVKYLAGRSIESNVLWSIKLLGRVEYVSNAVGC